MTSKLILDTLRTIRKTMAKFLTLFSIVAIGVAFFVGLLASIPIMRHSVDQYYDENHLMDFQLYATFGFDDADIAEIAKVDGVEQAVGNKFVDVVGQIEKQEMVIRIQSYQPNQEINDFILVEGRMPQNENECLAEINSRRLVGIELDQTVSISRPKDDLSDSMDVQELTIVGLIKTPEYLNDEKGYSTLNNRSIQTYMFVPESTFTTDYYTSVLITAQGAEEVTSFTNEYFDFIAPVEENLELLSTTQEQVRRNKIVAEATEKYNEGLQEYEDGQKEYNDEIAKAEKELANAKQKLVDGEQAIVDNQATLETETTNAEQELTQAQQDLEAGLFQWRQEKATFDNVTKPDLLAKQTELQNQLTPLNTVKSGLDQVNAGIASLTANKTQLEGYLATLDPVSPEYAETEANLAQVNVLLDQANQGKAEILNQLAAYGLDESSLGPTITQLQEGINQITSGIATGEASLASAKVTLDDGFTKVYNGQVELAATKVDAQAKIDQAKIDLEKAKGTLASSTKTFETEKEKGQKELDDAQRDLVKAKDDIDSIELAEWVILDRDENYSSKTYRDTIGQMTAIASIFPVFFFLVAALVCLTTMTRMIDEQRGQIGVLRAIGYNKFACASKYLIYAFVATLFGGALGSVVGLMIFPTVIYYAWGMMYQLPQISRIIPWAIIFISNLVFLTIMGCTTWLACRKSMNEQPSQLLRPKAPAMGKKIMLERLPFIWGRLSFTSKVTARNIVRYKKRFFMTVLGIAGCTALLVAGFGIKGSISTIVSKQFDDIYLYDGSAQLSDELTPSEITAISTQITALPEVDKSLELTSYTAKVSVGDIEHTASVSLYENNEQMQIMNDLRQFKTGEPIVLQENGVIINKKLSELLQVQVGDTIMIESENGILKEFVISDICEWYLNNVIFTTKSAYETAYSIKPLTNSIQIKLNTDTAEVQQEISSIEGVESLSFYGGVIESFNQMINGLDIVVVVLIVSAGLLAFVVLSNLTNVNISERQREIATLKVLGFNRKEVNAYIYKENFILTFIGSIVGLGLGIILHRFIILTVEMDYVMFGRTVSPLSLLYSVAITMIFAVFVNVAMTFKLRKIQMVESLKSVE